MELTSSQQLADKIEPLLIRSEYEELLRGLLDTSIADTIAWVSNAPILTSSDVIVTGLFESLQENPGEMLERLLHRVNMMYHQVFFSKLLVVAKQLIVLECEDDLQDLLEDLEIDQLFSDYDSEEPPAQEDPLGAAFVKSYRILERVIGLSQNPDHRSDSEKWAKYIIRAQNIPGANLVSDTLIDCIIQIAAGEQEDSAVAIKALALRWYGAEAIAGNDRAISLLRTFAILAQDEDLYACFSADGPIGHRPLTAADALPMPGFPVVTADGTIVETGYTYTPSF